MSEQALPFPVEPHAHLRLSRQLPQGDRRRRKRAIKRPPPNYPDQPSHGRFLASRYLALKAVHAQRMSVLGVDPALVIVIELHSTPPTLESSLRACKLEILEWFDDRVVVSAANDPDLSAFQERLQLYQQGPQSRETTKVPSPSQTDEDVQGTDAIEEERVGTAPHQALFDVVVNVRPYGASEAISPLLSAVLLNERDDLAVFLVDLQCWCPEGLEESRQFHDEVAMAVSQAGGTIHDKTLRHRAGLSLLRVEVSKQAIHKLASLLHLRRLDVLPRPMLTRPSVLGATAASLPIVLSPHEDAPIIAIIDSGVRSSHPLLAPAIVGLESVAGLDEQRDESGHGTFVASLALHGSLEGAIIERQPLRPAGRLLSIRVLDGDGQFPSTSLWESDLLAALALAKTAGARIVNLSVGDPRRIYQGTRPTPLAAALDETARRDSLVLVISIGNYDVRDYPASLAIQQDYVMELLHEHAASGLLDPASSALALTVGALCPDDGQGQIRPRENIDLQPVGAEGWPSPITRSGPGAAGMVKPELAMPGGGVRFDTTANRLVSSPDSNIVGADGTRPERVLALGAGSSFAAPLVTHVAARVLERTPSLTANAVRALVLASVRPPLVPFADTSKEAKKLVRNLSGYGRPNADRAAFSTDQRAVLLAEEELLVNHVHLFKVPVPPTFKLPGGWRSVTFGLAYDPPTRSTRLDYLANRMHVFAYRGVGLDAVAEAFLKDEQSTAVDGPEVSVEGPPDLSRFVVDLQPSDTERSRGTHHFGTWTRSQALHDESLIFVVRNMNNWDTDTACQSYALAVALERDANSRPLYGDLLAVLEAEAPVDIEQTIEIG